MNMYRSNSWPVLAALTAACIQVAQAQVAPSLPAENHILSNVPTPFAGANVNTIVGANRFYNAGITGQGTVTANVEAGLIWNGHESLTHVSTYAYGSSAWGSSAGELFDRHATAVGSHIGGRMTQTGGGAWQMGIAPGTDLQSGAIATG